MLRGCDGRPGVWTASCVRGSVGMKMRVLRCAPWGSKCASEAAAVNERQQHSKGAVAAELQQQELGFRRQLVGFAAPLWGHPPELDASACQESADRAPSPSTSLSLQAGLGRFLICTSIYSVTKHRWRCTCCSSRGRESCPSLRHSETLRGPRPEPMAGWYRSWPRKLDPHLSIT